MIFKKLMLKNFKSHINTEIEFNKGTTIILGDNGSGKSSIFEAINFVLYKKYNTKSLNDLINTKSNDMSVSLSFLVGNNEYKVIRTRSQKKSTAELFILKDNNYVSLLAGDKEVNNHIEALLEIDADLFLNAIYIKQGEIDSLVTQKASERKQNISKLLRLEKLETSYKNIPNVITHYELKKNQINSLIDDTFKDNKNELIKEQNILKNELKIKNNQLKSIQQKIKENKDKIDKQNILNITYQKLSNKKIQLETKAHSLSDSIDELDKQIKELEESEQTLNSLKNDISNIDSIQELLQDLSKKNKILIEINALENKLNDNFNKISFVNDIAKVYKNSGLDEKSSLCEQIIALEKLIDTDCLENKKAIHEIQKQIKQMIVEITKLETIITDNQELLKEVESIQGVCPTCQSILDEEHKTKLIDNYNNIVKDNSIKLEKRQKELDILQKEEIDLNQMLKEKMDFATKIQNANIVVQLIDADVSKKTEIEISLKNIKQKINNHMQLLNLNDCNEPDINILYHDLLEKQQQYQQIEFGLKNKQNIHDKYDSLKIEYHEIISDLEAVDNEILNLGFNSDLLRQCQEKQSELQNQYYPLVKDIGMLENDIKYNTTRIDNIDNKIKQNKENKDKVYKIEEFIRFLKDIREIYSKDGLQKDIRLAFRPQIEKYTQIFFSKFNFDYSELKLSEDYDIIITGPSGNSDISMVSGGEKIAIALSLRLGIAQSITSNIIETILLDEPTTYLDEFRKQEFVNVIQDISLVPQMILITHDPELENAADNIILLEKKNGESIVV